MQRLNKTISFYFHPAVDDLIKLHEKTYDEISNKLQHSILKSDKKTCIQV